MTELPPSIGWHDFMGDIELMHAAAGLADTPMFCSQDTTYKCRTTCYGGFASAEPHEPMPAWLANIRRSVELNLGLAYTFLNAAALICFVVDSDCVEWHEAPRDLRCVASLVLAGNAQVELRHARQLNAPKAAPALQLSPGQMAWTNRGVCPGSEMRMSPLPSAATSSARKRKTRPEQALLWHLMFMHLPATGAAAQLEQTHWLYRTFRYGAQLANVLREPQLKLTLQVATGVDTGKRQLVLEDMFPTVKKERLTKVKQERAK